MAQYAYIPASANPTIPNGMVNWQFTRNTVNYIGLESPLFTSEQSTYITSLGGAVFNGVDLFLKWYEGGVSNEVSVSNERVFCFSLQTRIIKKLKYDDAMTNAQRITLLGLLERPLNVLGWGDAQVARAAFNAIPQDDPKFWTFDRRTWVLAQLDTYINAQ